MASVPQRKVSRGGAVPAGVATASSALVPRGAYRRLLCVPVDAQWSAAPPPADKKVPPAGGTRKSTDNEGLCDRVSHAGGSTSSGDNPAEDGPCGSPSACGGGGKAGGQGAGTEAGNVEDVYMSFTLPPGSFATMFLREVMKRDDDVAWGGDTKKGDPDDSGADE